MTGKLRGTDMMRGGGPIGSLSVLYLGHYVDCQGMKWLTAEQINSEPRFDNRGADSLLRKLYLPDDHIFGHMTQLLTLFSQHPHFLGQGFGEG